MLLAFNVDVVAITEVIAFATASYVDETMHRPTFRQGLADVPLGFLGGNFGGDNQLNVEVLRKLDFFFCFLRCHRLEFCAKIRNFV